MFLSASPSAVPPNKELRMITIHCEHSAPYFVKRSTANDSLFDTFTLVVWMKATPTDLHPNLLRRGHANVQRRHSSESSDNTEKSASCARDLGRVCRENSWLLTNATTASTVVQKHVGHITVSSLTYILSVVQPSAVSELVICDTRWL